MSDTLVVMVEYRRNKATGKIHRLLRTSNGQLMSDERCNLDQVLNIAEEEFAESANPEDLCQHCFATT